QRAEIGDQRGGEAVPGQDVVIAADDVRGDVGRRVQQPLQPRAYALPLPRPRCRVPVRPGAGQPVEVRALHGVQAQGAGDGVQDGFGEVEGAALFQADVVIDADAGQQGEFLAAQAGDPSPAAVVRQSQLLGPQPGPSGAEEL